jgi:hypothetical protein
MQLRVKKRRKIMTENRLRDAERNLITSLRETNQALADSAIEAQDRNAKFLLNVFENGIDVLHHQTTSTRKLTQMLVEQSYRQQEAFRILIGVSVNAYLDFFSSWFSFYQGTWETVERTTYQELEATEKATRQGQKHSQ